MKRKFEFILIFIMLLTALPACKEDNLSLSDIIRFDKPDEESEIADNYSALMLTVIIPSEASAGSRSIQFTTDLGFFSNDSAKINIVANASGKAITYIHSAKFGKATVRATVAGYSQTKIVNFTLVELSNLIRFDKFVQDPLVADNLTQRTINIVIDKNTPLEKRSVVITTDLGTFTNQLQSITILADQSGDAQTSIKSDVAGTANIVAACNGFSTSTTLPFTAPNPDDIIKFDDGLAAGAPGDGTSLVEIKALINNNTPQALRKVTFTTDQGTFANGTATQDVMPDATGLAKVYLKNAVTGIATVSITHRNVVRQKTFNFTRALPDAISLNSMFVIKSGIENKVTIQSTLTRLTGKPSASFEIIYTALNNLQQPIGQFKNAVFSDINGLASVDYSAGTSSYRGPVTITATVKEIPAVNTATTITVTD